MIERSDFFRTSNTYLTSTCQVMKFFFCACLKRMNNSESIVASVEYTKLMSETEV